MARRWKRSRTENRVDRRGGEGGIEKYLHLALSPIVQKGSKSFEDCAHLDPHLVEHRHGCRELATFSVGTDNGSCQKALAEPSKAL